jgi:hypothetical protein
MYIQINQPDALKLYLFFLTMAPTYFGKQYHPQEPTIFLSEPLPLQYGRRHV